jgi:hypothetical protein
LVFSFDPRCHGLCGFGLQRFDFGLQGDDRLVAGR